MTASTPPRDDLPLGLLFVGAGPRVTGVDRPLPQRFPDPRRAVLDAGVAVVDGRRLRGRRVCP